MSNESDHNSDKKILQVKLDNILPKIFLQIQNGAIIFFFVVSVIFFSGIPPIAKKLLFSLLLVISLLNFFIPQKINNKLSSIVLISILLLWSYLLFNTSFISKIVYESKHEFINYNLYFFTFFVFSRIRKDRLTKLLSISGTIVLLIILIIYIKGADKDIYFFLYNPNIFSGYCLMIFIYSFGMLLKKMVDNSPVNTNISVSKKSPGEYILILNLVLSLFFIIRYKSFSTIFVLLLFVILLLWYHSFNNFFLTRIKSWLQFTGMNFHHRTLADLLRSVFVIVLLSSFVLGMVIDFNSFSDRIVWFLVGLKIWIKNFLFGIGLGNFRFYYPEYSESFVSTSSATIFVHNYFLHLGTELGLIGLFFILLVLYLTVFNPGFSFTNYHHRIPSPITFTIIAILLQNIVDYNLLIPQNSILFYTLLSINTTGGEIIPHQSRLVQKMFYGMTILFFITGIYLSSKFSKIEVLNNVPNEQNCKQIVSLDKSCWLAWKQLAVINFEKENFTEAEKCLTNVIKYNSRDAESYFYLSILQYKLYNDKNSAFKLFNKAVKLNPKGAKRYSSLLKEAISR